VGRRFEITAGALGKALLMSLDDDELERVLARAKLPALTERTCVDRADFLHELEKARPTGFVIAQGEFVDGVGGVAVPVMFDGGRPRAAISVAGPSVRVEGQLEHFGQLMLELTAALRPTAPSFGSVSSGH
jgi:DNA-binding IclR family transcriptional regulator